MLSVVLLCICVFVLGPLVFVGANGDSADSSDGMARCPVAVTVTTCVNRLSLIGSSCALLGSSCALLELLCPFSIIAAYFYVYFVTSSVNEVYVLKQ